MSAQRGLFGTLPIYMSISPDPLLCFSNHLSPLTHKCLLTICLHNRCASFTRTCTFRLLCALPYPKNQEQFLAPGRHCIKMCCMDESMNECREGRTEGFPLTHPDFHFLIISAHVLAAVRHDKRFPLSFLFSTCKLL